VTEKIEEGAASTIEQPNKLVDARGLMRGLARGEHRQSRFRWVPALVLLVAGCSSGAPPQTFDLSAVNSGLMAHRPRGQIEVVEPSATPALDSDRIVIRTSPEAIAYLTGAQWSARLPQLVQTRLVQTFENAKLVQSVGSAGQRFSADYALTSEIRSFEIDVQRGEALVEVAARLVAATSGRIVAAQIFSARIPATVTQASVPAVALDQALAEVMRAIVRWTATKI
jgi:cholesterol transport system auxiliary component